MASYTLILTTGMHFVDAANGEAILTAIADGEPSVTVEVDFIGDGFLRSGVRLSTSHVVALIPNAADAPPLDGIPFGSKVTAIRTQRKAR